MNDNDFDKAIAKLQRMIDESRSIVFFGGAGVSTESGIPDFRSTDGLYHQQWNYHKKLAELEKAGKLSAVVTQNIDGLHQAAGSKNVFELHGSTLRNYCMKCGSPYDIDFIAESANAPDGIPHCTKCGGIVKPDVVLYEEGLDGACIEGAVRAIRDADMLIIGGTSLVVYPAASLVNYYRGNKLVVINKTATGGDAIATLVIRDSIGKVLGAVKTA